jgi:hypothetical protein
LEVSGSKSIKSLTSSCAQFLDKYSSISFKILEYSGSLSRSGIQRRDDFAEDIRVTRSEEDIWIRYIKKYFYIFWDITIPTSGGNPGSRYLYTYIAKRL